MAKRKTKKVEKVNKIDTELTKKADILEDKISSAQKKKHTDTVKENSAKVEKELDKVAKIGKEAAKKSNKSNKKIDKSNEKEPKKFQCKLISFFKNIFKK